MISTRFVWVPASTDAGSARVNTEPQRTRRPQSRHDLGWGKAARRSLPFAVIAVAAVACAISALSRIAQRTAVTSLPTTTQR